MPSPNPMGGAILLSNFLNAVTSYLTCREQEKTKRKEIEAKLEAYLTTINRHYDLYEKTLSNMRIDNDNYFTSVEQLLQMPSVQKNHVLLGQVIELIGHLHAKAIDGYLGTLDHESSTRKMLGFREYSE